MKKPTKIALAIEKWGLEDPRTIAIAFLKEAGADDLADDLWRVCSKEEDE